MTNILLSMVGSFAGTILAVYLMAKIGPTEELYQEDPGENCDSCPCAYTCCRVTRQ